MLGEEKYDENRDILDRKSQAIMKYDNHPGNVRNNIFLIILFILALPVFLYGFAGIPRRGSMDNWSPAVSLTMYKWIK